MTDNPFKTIADNIVDAAPGISAVLLATGVGAPVAGAVAALGTLGRVFGLGSDAKPEDIHAAIQADPQAALKLRLAEMDFTLKQRDQDIDEMKALLLDVQNARGRDVAIRQAGRLNIRADIMLIAAFIAIVAGWIVIYLGGATLNSILIGSMTTVIGMFARNIGTAFDFEFGSSRGSMMKTEGLLKGNGS